LFLAGKVGRGGFGGPRGEPARGVGERRDQGEPGPAVRCLLRRLEYGLGLLQVGKRVRDVDELRGGVEQVVECERRV